MKIVRTVEPLAATLGEMATGRLIEVGRLIRVRQKLA